MRKDVDLVIGKDMRLVKMEIKRQMRKNLAPKSNALQDTRKIAQSLVWQNNMKPLLLLILFFISATLSAEEVVPDGFILQILEPTGGKIVRPKDWFYAERHGGPSYTWIISKEDVDKGPYDTGVRIQTIMGVEEGTGKSPKDFVLNFLEKKKQEAKKIFDECQPKDQGLFTRVCLETEEGPYRILYSAFWANGSDIVVISTAGAKLEEWGKYSEVFNRMSNFELIDMKRFEKN